MKAIIMSIFLLTGSLAHPRLVLAAEQLDSSFYQSRHRYLISRSESKARERRRYKSRGLDIDMQGHSGRGCNANINVGSVQAYGGLRVRSISTYVYVRGDINVNVRC